MDTLQFNATLYNNFKSFFYFRCLKKLNFINLAFKLFRLFLISFSSGVVFEKFPYNFLCNIVRACSKRSHAHAGSAWMPDFVANSGVHTSEVCAPEFAAGRRRLPAPALRESTSFGRSRELSREPDASASNYLLKSRPRRHEISVLVGAIPFRADSKLAQIVQKIYGILLVVILERIVVFLARHPVHQMIVASAAADFLSRFQHNLLLF